MLTLSIIRTRPILALAAAFAVLAGGATLKADQGRANSVAPTGRIAFVSNRTGSFEIFAINPDGTGTSQLTDAPGTDFWPSWSPDGSKIAFRSRRDLNSEIYVMNADGSNPTRITTNSVTDDAPSWSPDGSKIAFASARDGNLEIYVMNVDGTDVVRLTNDPALDLRPQWSPDGGHITFFSLRSGAEAVYTMKADGSNVKQITSDDLHAGQADWSPAGNRLVLVDNLCGDCPESDILVLKKNGKQVAQLTDTADNELDPVWSTDGKWIAFDSSPAELFGLSADIWVMKGDGSGAVNITNMPDTLNISPDWGPDEDDD